MNPALFLAIVIISYVILYFVIKYAVKSAIIEAHYHINSVDDDTSYDSDNNGIAKTICPYCGKSYDMDFPKCPYCG